MNMRILRVLVVLTLTIGILITAARGQQSVSSFTLVNAFPEPPLLEPRVFYRVALP